MYKCGRAQHPAIYSVNISITIFLNIFVGDSSFFSHIKFENKKYWLQLKRFL